MRRFPEYIVSMLLAFIPLAAFAAAPTTLKEFATLLVKILQTISGLLMVSLSVGLIWGVVVFFANAENEQKRESIRGYLLWGVIGLVVIVGIWGILGLVSGTFGWAVGIPQLTPPSGAAANTVI